MMETGNITTAFDRSDQVLGKDDTGEYRVVQFVVRNRAGTFDLLCPYTTWEGRPEALRLENAALRERIAKLEDENAELWKMVEPSHAAQETEAAEAESPPVVQEDVTARVRFNTEGIAGLNGRELLVSELTTYPIASIEIGRVAFTPGELRAMIAEVMAGKSKSAVLKTMPGFNNRKWSQYANAYELVRNRIIEPSDEQTAEQTAQVADYEAPI